MRRTATRGKRMKQNPNSAAHDRLVRFSEAAERLGCNRDSLHNLCRRIGLKKYKLPGHVRASGLLESEIDKLLATGKGA